MTNRKTLSCRNNTYIFKLKNTKNIYFRDVGKNKLIFFSCILYLEVSKKSVGSSPW